MKNNLEAAADRLDALSEAEDESALAFGIAVTLPTLRLDGIREALTFYRTGSVGNPLGDALMRTYVDADENVRGAMTNLFPDAFLPLDTLLSGDLPARAAIEEFVETRALPEGTLDSFTSWEPGATEPIPDTGLDPWEGYFPVKIGDRVRVTSDPVPWALAQAEADKRVAPEMLDELRAVAEANTNKVGVEFVVTDVAFMRNGSRLSAIVQGDPGGRGMLTCNLELVASA